MNLFSHQQNAASNPSARTPIPGLAGWINGLLQRRLKGPAQPPRLEMIERLPLTAHQSVALVRCGSQIFLAGCGAQGVTALVAVSSPLDDGWLPSPVMRDEP